MIIKRLLLRKHLNRLLAEGNLTTAQTNYVNTLIGSPRMVRALGERVDHEADGKVRAIGDGKILQWLWDNRDQILAFVLQIIKLFQK